MKKQFDLSAKAKTSLWKSVRIDPQFFSWKKDLFIFALFLGLIFTGVFLWKSYIASVQLWQFFQKQNIEVPVITNIQDIQNTQQELLPFLETTQNTLFQFRIEYPKTAFFSNPVLNIVESLQKDTYEFVVSLSDLQKAVDISKKTSSLEAVLYYWEQNKDLIYSLQSHASWLKFFAHFSDKQIPENIVNIIENFETYADTFETILGAEEPQRYIILLQNAHEKRATGGFVGSFIELVINDGAMISMQIHDIYEYDGQITSTSDTPELAKSLVGTNFWSLRDANYSPDFSVSAKAFMKLFEKAGGQSIDTVIAIDNVFVENFLAEFGGMFLDEIPFELNEKNISFILSYITEGKLNNVDPKSFLKYKLFPEFINNLKSQVTNFTQVENFFQANKERIQIFSQNKNINTLAKNLEMGNNFETIINNQNTIPVMQLSVSGNKSDAFVTQNLSIENVDMPNQFAIHVSRFHNWSSNQENLFQQLSQIFPETNIEKSLLKDLLGHGTNHDIFYFFLPKQIEFISAEGFENIQSFKEFNRKIIEITLPLLASGESQEMSLILKNNDRSQEILNFTMINK